MKGQRNHISAACTDLSHGSFNSCHMLTLVYQENDYADFNELEISEWGFRKSRLSGLHWNQFLFPCNPSHLTGGPGSWECWVRLLLWWVQLVSLPPVSVGRTGAHSSDSGASHDVVWFWFLSLLFAQSWPVVSDNFGGYDLWSGVQVVVQSQLCLPCSRGPREPLKLGLRLGVRLSLVLSPSWLQVREL